MFCLPNILIVGTNSDSARKGTEKVASVIHVEGVVFPVLPSRYSLNIHFISEFHFEINVMTLDALDEEPELSTIRFLLPSHRREGVDEF